MRLVVIMSVFPNYDPTYYTDEDRDMKSRMNDFYKNSVSLNQEFWTQAEMDTKFEAGDQSIDNDIFGTLPLNRQKQYCFNRIRRIVNMVSGHQRKHRKSTVVSPVEHGDTETADQFSKIMMWINQREGVLETISDAFHGALVTGLNLLQIWVDYRSDPMSGNIKVDNCSYNSFLLDPYFRKRDLSDPG